VAARSAADHSTKGTFVNLLRVDASIQGPNSASSGLADIVLASLANSTQSSPNEVRRHLGADPLPSDAWAQAVMGSFTPEAQRSPAQLSALSLAREVAAELRDADVAVLALPLYNWGVSQHVKAWIDLAIAGGEQGEQLLAGTPTVLITTRGGAYGPGTPKEGWDHSIDYLRRILADVWGAELTVIERELTLVGVNPALDFLAEQGAAAKVAAEQAAADAGRRLGGLVLTG
jgi:FMN-dependent NADH-azoreductase